MVSIAMALLMPSGPTTPNNGLFVTWSVVFQLFGWVVAGVLVPLFWALFRKLAQVTEKLTTLEATIDSLKKSMADKRDLMIAQIEKQMAERNRDLEGRIRLIESALDRAT